MNLYSALYISPLSLKRSWPVCNKAITQFNLPPTHEPYQPLLPSRKASPPFDWYSLHFPTKGQPGWVDLGSWTHSEIEVQHWKLNRDTVTHPSTNRARRRLTSMIETNTLSLRQTTSVVLAVIASYIWYFVRMLLQ